MKTELVEVAMWTGRVKHYAVLHAPTTLCSRQYNRVIGPRDGARGLRMCSMCARIVKGMP